MADDAKIEEFPEINNKLAAPTKKSLFERQRAEADAKRRRDEAETAAALKDFVKSFDDDDHDKPSMPSSSRAWGRGGSSVAERGGSLGASRRQFAGGPPTGPAGRGSPYEARRGAPSRGAGSIGPPPSLLARKRGYEGSDAGSRGVPSVSAYDDSIVTSGETKGAFGMAQDDSTDLKAERAAPKPTLHLSRLPPNTSPATIKSLLAPHLTIEHIRILPPPPPASTECKSMAAIVTLAKDTPAADIDTAVNTLSNRYLGYGYNLSLSRHLSSAALNVGVALHSSTITSLSSLPFGAKALDPVSGGGALNRAPPPSSVYRGGFAPPTSYNTSSYPARGIPQVVHVSVRPPADLQQLKLIHKTLEALITHGPEFEALLMSRPSVQRDERWSWIWDPRSTGGVWYRWRLWQILSGSRAKATRGATKGRSEFVFDSGAAWTAPSEGLKYEFVTALEEAVEGSEYDSSEEDGEGEDETNGKNHGGAPTGERVEGSYLNPLRKAKLTHLLARLPINNARLRKGDVARVTAFAIEHAGEGAGEVVDLIVRNVERPFAFTAANPDHAMSTGDEGLEGPDEHGEEKQREQDDQTPAILVGLYVVSDILSSSSTSGVRHAWRYRQLFETALKRWKIFEYLGRLERTHQWGKLRAEKWRRSIGGILTLWEGWCVFPQAAQEHFVAMFNSPPPTAREIEEKKIAEDASEGRGLAKSKWKTVDVDAMDETADGGDSVQVSPKDAFDGEDEVDGGPMDSDVASDIDGVPMEDVDGESMKDDEDEPMESNQFEAEEAPALLEGGVTASLAQPNDQEALNTIEADVKSPPVMRRRPPRPKAEDMFADSDEE